ncbi:MAG: 3-isopropylmalate dehydratase large subunit [Bacteroidetes bacterium]|nr:3-isopropylmalate dehydratase large subunit [Bacteroidota bacterium]MBU1718557.1 3-isopropylmalate dehydratase large subunit [Bacteroidota bacterium]
MTIIEKILAAHSGQVQVKPEDIIDVEIDARVARDFGGANVVKNLVQNGLKPENPAKTCFTFDCNPGGSDQNYAANQQYCRLYAREHNISVFDVNSGIGTHIAIDLGIAYPGSTFVSTDSHANIMGAIGSFGQGMGDQDIAAAWARGKVWFKVPASVKLKFNGQFPANVTAKDIVLNLLGLYGANTLLGYSAELTGDCIDRLSLDDRITVSSMATEMGAIILMFTPSDAVLDELARRTGKRFQAVVADQDANYDKVYEIDACSFVPMVARPGHPEDDVAVEAVKGTKIDSAFIGSCTNGRLADLRVAATILKGRKVAPGVVLKIVPATDAIWMEALDEGLVKIFKDAGALLSNAGCAGCAAGQVGQNGPEEITISSGNRNFSGKQGKGAVYLASPAVVAASAVAGYITTPDQIPVNPAVFEPKGKFQSAPKAEVSAEIKDKPVVVEGRVWFIKKDNIDTDMIFHNRYLTITDINLMGQYAFDNLEGYEDFAKRVKPNDIIVTQKNFGAGSSRQQAVDCFSALGVSCIIAESYGAIYERNAINAGMPILTYNNLQGLGLENGDPLRVNFITGELTNLGNGKTITINPFYDVQTEIYQRGGLLAK